MKAEWKSILDEVKRIATAFKKEPLKFATATLQDGTVVEWEGELAVGTELFVVDGETRVPAPVGTHTTTEGLQVVVEEVGIVSAIVEPIVEEEELKEEEKVEQTAEVDLSAVTNLLETVLSKVAEMDERHKADIEAVRSEFNSFKSLPSNAVTEKTKFTKDSNLTARQQFLMNNLKK